MSDNSNSEQQLDQDETLPVLEIPNIRASFDLVKSVLNNSCKAGSFDLDQALQVHVSLENLNKTINSLEKYQNLVLKHINKNTDNDLNVDA
jgi:hypothetical protein